MMARALVGALLAVWAGWPAVMLAGALLARCHQAPASAARAEIVPPGDLDRIEARLLASRAIVERWSDLADRRQQVEPIVCDALAMHEPGPLPQEVR